MIKQIWFCLHVEFSSVIWTGRKWNSGSGHLIWSWPFHVLLCIDGKLLQKANTLNIPQIKLPLLEICPSQHREYKRKETKQDELQKANVAEVYMCSVPQSWRSWESWPWKQTVRLITLSAVYGPTWRGQPAHGDLWIPNMHTLERDQLQIWWGPSALFCPGAPDAAKMALRTRATHSPTYTHSILTTWQV